MEVVRRQPDIDVEPEPSELLGRLERQAAESGRLVGHVEALEGALETERDARRRLAATLKRERKAAEALHGRAQRAEAAEATQAEELERLRHELAAAEQQSQVVWMQLAEAERQLAAASVPLWRRVLRRPRSA
jgi:chromosome segregation ATPase